MYPYWLSAASHTEHLRDLIRTAINEKLACRLLETLGRIMVGLGHSQGEMLEKRGLVSFCELKIKLSLVSHVMFSFVNASFSL